MYSIFVNDKPIIFTSSLKKENEYPVYIFKDANLDKILHKLVNKKLNGVNIFCTNIEKDFQYFKNHFIIEIAAGGLVTNKKNEVLFIYRAGKWDLPKGHIEKGEDLKTTAIREVEEECGITNLNIQHFLTTTYHLFFRNGKTRLKETHWFYMQTDFKGVLIPQLEEGISKAIFKNSKETTKALENTFANIRLVFDEFVKSTT